MTEVFKFFMSLFLLFKSEEANYSWGKLVALLKKHIWESKMDTLKVCIPSAIFLVQVLFNFLFYIFSHKLP